MTLSLLEVNKGSSVDLSFFWPSDSHSGRIIRAELNEVSEGPGMDGLILSVTDGDTKELRLQLSYENCAILEYNQEESVYPSFRIRVIYEDGFAENSNKAILYVE